MFLKRMKSILMMDQFVSSSLEEQRNRITKIISTIFFFLGFAFTIFQILLSYNDLGRLVLGILATSIGFIGFLLFKYQKYDIGRLYFTTGFTVLVYGAIFYWGLVSFAYPAIFAISILATIVTGLRGLIYSTITSISLITSFVVLNFSDFIGFNENVEINYLEFYFVQILIIIFTTSLLFMNRIDQNNLIYETTETKNKYENVLKYSPDGIIITDSNWIIIEVNNRIFEISGYQPSEIIGQEIMNFVQPNTMSLFTEYERQIKTSGTAEFKSSFINQRHERIQFDFRGTRLKDEKILHIVRDITKEKEVQEEFDRMREIVADNQRMDAVRKISANIAHDFNNLLAAVVGYAEVGEITTKNEDDVSLFKNIKLSAARGKTLTRRLLSFTQKNVHNPEYIDIDQEILNMGVLLKKILGSGIQINFDLNSNGKGIFMDKMDFEQIVINLIMNSKDVSIDGDIITISTKIDNYENPLQLDLHQIKRSDESVIEFIISDEGGGVIGELGKIFDPFYTTKEHGTGLGLNIVYNIVEKNDGYVGIKSTEKGVSVVIYLPTVSEVIQLEEMLDDNFNLPELKILLVEDEVSVRTSLSKFLEKNEHRVTHASNGEEAISILKRTLDFDLVISDVIMPKIDGYSLLNWMEQIEKPIPILFMTGYANLLDPSDFNIQKMIIIEKPFTMNILKEKISRILKLNN